MAMDKGTVEATIMLLQGEIQKISDDVEKGLIRVNTLKKFKDDLIEASDIPELQKMREATE